MKKKHMFRVVAALLVACGVWIARTAWHTPATDDSSAEVGAGQRPGPVASDYPRGLGAEGKPGATNLVRELRPPEPNRRFSDFTPEQRVEFARRGHGPGG